MVLKQNKDKIDLLKNNKFFLHKITNEIGLYLVEYLQQGTYKDLVNRERVNPKKNTLSKILNYLKAIDDHIKKPLDKYTQKDLIKFMNDVQDGKVYGCMVKTKHLKGRIECEITKSKKPIHTNNLNRYIIEFKRFWKIYRQYRLHKEGKKFKQIYFEWGEQLRSPKLKKVYEDFSEYSLTELIEISNSLENDDYKNRFLTSLNLMGRKCEISTLKRSSIEIKDNGEVWIKLPNVKKNSSDKVSVELYDFSKNPLVKYLKTRDFKPNDLVFPAKEPAFAKNLKNVSLRLYPNNKHLTPKILRKLGVSVAEELGTSRSDVERIGGWIVNSLILNHYFKRKGVSAKKDINKKINEDLTKDLTVEIDKIKIENKKLKTDIQEYQTHFKLIHKKVDRLSKIIQV